MSEGIHSADPERDALLSWILHDSGRPQLFAAAWQRLLSTPEFALTPSADKAFKAQISRLEAEMVQWALARSGGNKAKAARELGVKRTTLSAKLKRARSRGLLEK